MRIVVAPDSFKGSLGSVEAAGVMERAIMDVDADCVVDLRPMADGGEGTLESVLEAKDGVRVEARCVDALGRSVVAEYGIVDGDTAVIECAAVVGLPGVPAEKRDPDLTSSFGVGELMLDALDRGCERLIVALGGSATNDGGLGMLYALGMRAFDKGGGRVCEFGADVAKIHRVDMSGMDPRLRDVGIQIASDVDNPLCGERGATAVFGPQKGATEEQVVRYDKALNDFGLLLEAETDIQAMDVPGAGAAGGLGFALLMLGGDVVSGAKLVAETMEMAALIKSADLVLTGEGQSDEQTLYGKAPGYIASMANQCDVPVVLISGCLDGDMDALSEVFSGCFSIAPGPISLEECIENAGELLFEQTKQVVHLIQSVSGGCS